jgi:hypothetical protein
VACLVSHSCEFEMVQGTSLTEHSWVYTGEQSSAEDYAEIDIVENVNAATANSHSIYTGQQCTINANEGEPTRGKNCHHESGETDGCSFMAEEGTFGNAFNENNYRVVALQVEADNIKIWHFKDGEVPSDISSGNPDPSQWKTPNMDISPNSCDFQKAFSKFFVVSNPLSSLLLLVLSITNSDIGH